MQTYIDLGCRDDIVPRCAIQACFAAMVVAIMELATRRSSEGASRERQGSGVGGEQRGRRRAGERRGGGRGGALRGRADEKSGGGALLLLGFMRAERGKGNDE